MCVIVHLPAGKTLPHKVLENCYNRNRDGYGIIWTKPNEQTKLWYYKNTLSFKDFLTMWQDVPRGVDRAIHFRIKTHGKVNVDNCHPFFPRNNLAMMHNGIIQTLMRTEDMNDTFNFSEHELKPVLKNWDNCLSSKGFLKFVESLTDGSKLLFMDDKGTVKKTFESKWTEEQGCFFSNTSFQGWNAVNSTRSTHNSHRRTLGSRYDSVLGKWVDNYSEDDWGDSGGLPYSFPRLEHAPIDHPSDLYSGSKGDKEGQDELSAEDAARIANIMDIDEVNAQIAKDLAAETTDIAEDEEEEGEEFLTLDELQAMSPEDVCDWLQDNPTAATLVLFEAMGRETELERKEGVIQKKA